MTTKSAFQPTWSGLTAWRANSMSWTGFGTLVSRRISRLPRSQRISRGNASCARCGSRMPRYERPDSSVRASRSPASIPTPSDGGNFGREEIDAIGPAAEEAVADGIAAEGPFPADTVFLRAKSGALDAVLTMYHDHRQIAMKLMGFDRGVKLLGGFPYYMHTGTRKGLRHRWKGNRSDRSRTRGYPACRGNGAEAERI
jgi:Pyridoxal phosphate biosynthetic protein PdxA